MKKQICKECDQDVSVGSGNFINRIPVLDESDDPNVELFVCQKCDVNNEEDDIIFCPECGDVVKTVIVPDEVNKHNLIEALECQFCDWTSY